MIHRQIYSGRKHPHALFMVIGVCCLVIGLNVALASDDGPDINSRSINTLTKAKFAVGQVIASNKSFSSSGTGVLTDAHAGVFTNLHVIAGSTSIHFIPEVTKKKIQVHAIAIWPEVDLALLVPSSDAAFINAGMKPLRIYYGEHEVGGAVTSIGYPRGLGYSMTRGIISGVRVFKDLPVKFRSGWERDPDSEWVQTDCAVNPGNSGGPLLNAQHELVGINTWGSNVDNGIYFALSSNHLRSVLAEKPEGSVIPKISTGKKDDGGLQAVDLTVGSDAVSRQLVFPALLGNGGSGYLQLNTTPNTEILLDGMACGRTTAAETIAIVKNLKLKKDYVLEVRREGYCSRFTIVRIPSDGVALLKSNADQPLLATLKIVSMPVDCEVSIEGPVTGMKMKTEPTAVFHGLPPGTYTVGLVQSSGSFETTVELEAGTSITLKANFIENNMSEYKSDTTLTFLQEVLKPEDDMLAKMNYSSPQHFPRNTDYNFAKVLWDYRDYIASSKGKYRSKNILAKIRFLAEKKDNHYDFTHAWVVDSIDRPAIRRENARVCYGVLDRGIRFAQSGWYVRGGPSSIINELIKDHMKINHSGVATNEMYVWELVIVNDKAIFEKRKAIFEKRKAIFEKRKATFEKRRRP